MPEQDTTLSRPRERTIKALFALCRNLCAFPRCTVPAYDPAQNSVLVEVCHIEGHKPDSARYRQDQPEEERHGIDNLILMCGVHHKIIDDDEVSYTVQRLKQIKADHERDAAGDPVNPKAEEIASTLLANFSAGVIYASTVIVSQNQMGGQVAHTIINNATPRRQLSAAVARQLITELQQHSPREFDLYRVSGDSEVNALTKQIEETLQQAGWTMKADIIMFDSQLCGVKMGLQRMDRVPTEVDLLARHLYNAKIMDDPSVTTVEKAKIPTIYIGYRGGN